MDKKIIITIDGEGGSGKGTTAKGVAKKLNYKHIDSGAMYRVVSFFLSEKNINFKDDEKIKKELKNLIISFNSKSQVLLNEKNIENKIRNSKIDALVFKYAQNSIIRNFINKRQKELLKNGEFVIDGRDMGSIVFPQAELKIYLICDLNERAQRRSLDYKKSENSEEIKKIKKEIKNRDNEDKNRKESPLIIPKNAIVIDTTNLTIKEQINKVYQLALKIING